MKSFETYNQDTDPQSPIQQIIRGALGKVTPLDSAPTTLQNSIPEGEFGFFSGNLYHKQDGKVYKLPLTLV